MSELNLKLRQITEVVRYLVENPNYVVTGNWYCHNWRCQHNTPCNNEMECKNACPHEPPCKDEKCGTKWKCIHEPKCETRVNCQRRWSCRHEPVCQNKLFCQKNWHCKHKSKCRDIWKCKYLWTEKYEPRCQGRWECCHERKCSTKKECQQKNYNDPWYCPHEHACYNKWSCQNKWQCQHLRECDMDKPRLMKKYCQAMCQHKCENEEECWEESQNTLELLPFGSKWKCQHQCEPPDKCQKQWKCSHVQHEHKCENQRMCRYRSWRCEHSPPCNRGTDCQEKWDKINQWECKHFKECQSNWQCLNDPSYQNKWECQGNWQLKYSQDQLKAILTKSNHEKHDFFTKWCKMCNKDCLITSFLLNSVGLQSEGYQPIEIVCHLIWAKPKSKVFYRVYGWWNCPNTKCPHFQEKQRNLMKNSVLMQRVVENPIDYLQYCQNQWESSYTWISLQAFVLQKFQKLDLHDFCKMDCRECREDGSICKWKKIEGSKDAPFHDRTRCGKCQSGDICVQIGSYFGNRYSRRV